MSSNIAISKEKQTIETNKNAPAAVIEWQRLAGAQEAYNRAIETYNQRLEVSPDSAGDEPIKTTDVIRAESFGKDTIKILQYVDDIDKNSNQQLRPKLLNFVDSLIANGFDQENPDTDRTGQVVRATAAYTEMAKYLDPIFEKERAELVVKYPELLWTVPGICDNFTDRFLADLRSDRPGLGAKILDPEDLRKRYLETMSRDDSPLSPEQRAEVNFLLGEYGGYQLEAVYEATNNAPITLQDLNTYSNLNISDSEWDIIQSNQADVFRHGGLNRNNIPVVLAELARLPGREEQKVNLQAMAIGYIEGFNTDAGNNVTMTERQVEMAAKAVISLIMESNLTIKAIENGGSNNTNDSILMREVWRLLITSNKDRINLSGHQVARREFQKYDNGVLSRLQQSADTANLQAAQDAREVVAIQEEINGGDAVNPMENKGAKAADFLNGEIGRALAELPLDGSVAPTEIQRMLDSISEQFSPQNRQDISPADREVLTRVVSQVELFVTNPDNYDKLPQSFIDRIRRKSPGYQINDDAYNKIAQNAQQQIDSDPNSQDAIIAAEVVKILNKIRLVAQKPSD